MINMTEKKTQFIYKMISPYEIMKADMHLLGSIFDSTMIGNRNDPLAMKIRNQRILEAYFTKMGIEGWELVCSVDYEGLPHNGTLVFKKKIEVEIEKEVSNVTADFSKDAKQGHLYDQFKDETGKNAIWHDKETQNYKRWEKKKLDDTTDNIKI